MKLVEQYQEDGRNNGIGFVICTSLFDIVGVMKSRRIGWAGHVARMRTTCSIYTNGKT